MPRGTHRSHLRRSLATVIVALAGGALPLRATVAPPAAEALLGLWIGSAGTARERVDVGLELRRDERGALLVRLTVPVANYYGLELPETVAQDDGRLTNEMFGLSVGLVGDRLEGSFPAPHVPLTLVRATALPVEPPPPTVPALPAPKWRKRVGGQIYASPTVYDGHVYVGTTGGVMNAFRAADGRFVWAFPAGRPILGAALATDEAVYFACDDGRLYKLRRADGHELWRYDLGDARTPRVLPHPALFDWDWQGPRPLVADGTIYVGAGDGSFHAVDAGSGARRWRFAAGAKIRNGAAIDGGRVVFGSADRHLYALDRASGALVWKHDTGHEVDGEPVVHDGKVLVGNRGGGLLAVSAATGERLWLTDFWGSWVESTPTVADGVVYVGSSDLRRVSAIDPDDGRVLWRSDVFGWTWGTPLVVGDRIYAGAAGGAPYFLRHVASLAEIDRATGRLLRRTPLPDSADAHQWGIGGSLARAGDVLVATTIEGAILGYPLP